MFDYPYVVELLSPKRSVDDRLEDLLDRFAERYRQIAAAGCGLSIPDNPMGQPRLGALESIKLRGLQVDPDKLVMNLNTFHTKSELDGLLRRAADAGLTFILIVRGDGGPLLPKLDPKAIGGKRSVATSIDLIRYINAEHPNRFITGAAFNPYKPMSSELNRLKQKIDAGARFVVTQPIIGKNANVDRLTGFQVTLVVEAWMSTNVALFYKSVGQGEEEAATAYDPVENLKVLHDAYPGHCIYLSMLGFNRDWGQILPRLAP